jgi:ADP-sugar diphosphatase
MISIGRFAKIPIKFKYSQLEEHLENILTFSPFLDWRDKFAKSLTEEIVIKQIIIQDVDFFGPRIGFIKYLVDVSWKDGKKLPGIVFCRGSSVACLVLVSTLSDKTKWCVLVDQPRIPMGTMSSLELPAGTLILIQGMVDPGSGFAGAAAQELQEECGMTIAEHEMIPMGKPLVPSGGACDETIQIFLVEKVITKEELESLRGRLTGLRDHGERIKVKLVKLEDLVHATSAMSAIAAIALYEARKQRFD